MKIFIIFAILVISSSFLFPQNSVMRDDLKKFFDEYGVEGSFTMCDFKNDKYVMCNIKQFQQEFTPASTFKICNSLIGIETGVIQDENFVIKWDSIPNWTPDWDKDFDLATAFKVSAVWYYQELARRVGEDTMKKWVKKAHYGNENIEGGIDKFWLSGKLRISPANQIYFLKNLYLNRLPFSQRSMDIVKKIMIAKQDSMYTLRAKTGWGMTGDTSAAALNNIGWYVGYLEKGDNIYFFATCLQADEAHTKDFKKARIDITMRIFKELGIIQE